MTVEGKSTMTAMRYLLLCPFLLILAVDSAKNSDKEDSVCRLYMAKSSTSTADWPLWGVYAGVDFDEAEQLGEPDVAIQMHNVMAHAMEQDDTEEDEYEMKSLERRSVEIMEQFTWVADSSGAKYELEPDEKINTAIPGTALLAAYGPKMANAAFNHTSSYFRPVLNEKPGQAHAGRGAYSHFYNVAMRTTTMIPAGFEIFMDYGENFKDEDEEDAKLTSDDYKKVDQLVESMIEFMDNHKDELDDAAKKEIYNFIVHDVMSAAAGSKKGKLVTNILPDHPDELAKVKEAGGSLIYASPQLKKEMEWLQTEGFCMDNLVVGGSTIPNAGRGAFTRRSLKRGETIAPVPLLHIPDKAMVDMHELGNDGDHAFRKSQNVTHQQLFLNYCLGHPESSMLFFPVGGIVPLINHDSKKQNAKLVWSTHPGHNAHWLEKTPTELSEIEFAHIGLLMELVATRDIKKGEEVFLDYGKEWEQAWNSHVKDWNSKITSGELKSEWPLRALDLNQEYKTKPYKTAKELKEDPYPDHVSTQCFLFIKNDSIHTNKPLQWVTPGKQSIFITDFLYPCNVTDRKKLMDKEEGAYNYTVVTGIQNKRLTIENVPQEAITFLDKPKTSDQFFRGGFRHEIGIPDEIFPKGPWRNFAEKT